MIPTYAPPRPQDTPRIADTGERPLGLYIHIPFCAQKCPYCDFNTYAGLESRFDAYLDALGRELILWSQRLNGRTVQTVFLGGGTPTVLEAAHLARIFEILHRHFTLAAHVEITSEANPGTADRTQFALLRALGVNRLSMGVQSFRPDELRFLGRIHSADEAEQAFAAARAAGFDNVNLDFIFGLPHQTSVAWEYTLERALALAPEHLSLYSLIVEANTPLHHWVETGRVDAPDEDTAALLYEMAMEHLDAAGYLHYEVSNWARRQGDRETGRWGEVTPSSHHSITQLPDHPTTPSLPFACRHNLIYWRNQEYIGVGAGAHSHVRLPFPGWEPVDPAAVAVRWSNRRPVSGYIRRMQEGASVEAFREELTSATSMGETMMLGLRLIQEGVSCARFRRLHGVELDAFYGAELRRLQENGLIQVDSERVRLTRRGVMVGNRVFAAFLA